MRALVSCIVFAAQADDEVGDGLAEQCVFVGVARLEGSEAGGAGLLELAGLSDEAVALAW